MLFSIVLLPVMQVWNYHDGFRWMLRLSSFLGIFWWCSCLLLLSSASLDATSTNSSSSSSSNDSGSSAGRMFGGFLFRRRTNQVADSNNNNINVEEEELPLDWTLDDAEDKTFHSDDVRLPWDPEAYMSSVRKYSRAPLPLFYYYYFLFPPTCSTGEMKAIRL